MSTDTKKKMDTTPGKRIPGSKKEIRKEVKEILVRRFKDGIFHAHFGAGQFVNHLVPSIMSPVSFCGRFCGDTSTGMVTTPIGKVCGACMKIHKETFLEWMDNTALDIRESETERLKALGNMREMISENPNWHAELIGAK